MYINLFNPCINPMREVLSPDPFHRWGNKVSESISNFPNIIHPVMSTVEGLS